MQNLNLTSLPTNDEGNTPTQVIIQNADMLSGIAKLFIVQNKYLSDSEIIVSSGNGTPFDYLNKEECNALGAMIFDASDIILSAVRQIDSLHQGES